MRIQSLVALTILLAAPRLSVAQLDGWGPAIRITPFIGISPSVIQLGEATVVTNAGSVLVHDVETHFNSGIGFGVGAEVQVWNALTIMGSGIWSSRGAGAMIDRQDDRTYEMSGSNFWILKTALALRLREFGQDEMAMHRVNGTVYVGPALLTDDPNSDRTTPTVAPSSERHTALNMGAEAEVRLWDDRVNFVLAADDYMVFWDNDMAAGRVAAALQSSFPGAVISMNARHSHLWMFRFGVALHF